MYEPIELEFTGFRLRGGFDVWNAKGKLILQTASMNRVLGRRAKYFRVNATGKIFRLISRQESREIPRHEIRWLGSETIGQRRGGTAA